jgi:pyruvate formate lyase activating enzyme
MHKCILYKKGKEKSVQCQACSWYCKIPEGHTGICGVRLNDGGDLYLLVYGKPVSVHLDNIEKKPLFHFLPATKIFSLGTIGCNFRCAFCQNWDISQAAAIIKNEYPEAKKHIEMIKKAVAQCEDWPPEKIVDYCLENNIPSIAYTYNEPAIFFEYAYDTAKLAHKKGIKNIYVSNGYESKENLEKFHEYMDAINIDIKGFTEEFYANICGARLAPVLENVKRCKKLGIWVELTTLLIPGKNDSDKEITQIAEFIKSVSDDIPWHVTAFYPNYKMLDIPPTPSDTLLRAYNIGKKAGLKFVYTGNIPGLEGENTSCPKCDSILVKRYGLECETNKIKKDGKCPVCKEKIAGIWK